MPMRHIGIVHRVKKSAAGEARPTQVAITENGKTRILGLVDEQAELDFVLGSFPTAFKKPEPDNNLTGYKSHQIKWRKAKADESEEQFPGGHTRPFEKTFEVVDKVPTEFDGLKAGDIAAMTFGGSGDYLAFALGRQGEKIGAHVWRIPPFILKDERGKPALPDRSSDVVSLVAPKKADTSEDHILLARLIGEKPQIFQPLSDRDRELIAMREAWRALEESMKARMAAEARLRQLFIGRIFTNPEGLFPEGDIEKRYDEAKSNDVIFNALVDEEKARDRDLTRAIKKLPVYREVFEPIEGVGPRIAARIISAIGDIRRFETDAKLKAFCGVHVLADGRLPRGRTGERCNWNRDARQAFFLVGDQFNRRPDSAWGVKFREVKARLRVKHPEPAPATVADSDNPGRTKTVMRYTNQHIHNMARWRTLSLFVKRLFKDWRRLEREGKLKVAA